MCGSLAIAPRVSGLSSTSTTRFILPRPRLIRIFFCEAGRRIGQIRRKQVPFAETMQEEKWCVQAGLLEVMRSHPLGRDASLIGEVVDDHPGMVVMRSLIGGERVVTMLSGEQLPRIC